MPKRKELTGKRFGHLTVTGPAGERENGYQVWNCAATAAERSG